MIDGVTQTAPATASMASGNGDTDCNFGLVDNGVTWDLALDDVLISQTTGDYPIGPGQVHGVTFDQAAAAEHQSITTTQWQYGTITGSTFTSTANFASDTETDSRSRLNDLGVADGAGAIRMNAGSAGQAGNARWPLASPTVDLETPPNGVRGIFTGQEPSTGTNNATVRVLLGASTTNIFSGNPGWGTSWDYIGAILSRPGGGVWTAQDIRDLKIEMDSTDSAPALHIGGAVIEVDYPDVRFQPRQRMGMDPPTPHYRVF
jgi:hypothetical protein